MHLKSEKNHHPWPDSNLWLSVPREEDVGEPQTTRPSNEMMIIANFLDHNPRQSAIFRWNSTHSRPQILWVRESWSLPLNLKLPNGLYFHITMEKRATLLRFSSHERLKLFLSTFFWSFYSINKMSDKIFFILGHRSRPFSDFFTSFRKSF